jgi:hypothetical protein
VKKYLFTLLLFFLFSDSEFLPNPSYVISINDKPSEIGGREDLMGRNEYLQLLTADPKTGQIPPGIAKAELRFSENHLIKTSRFRTQQLQIQSLGPDNVGGRTRAVAFDIRNEDIILAGGVSGGVWKSLDGGITWSKKSHPENRNSVTCIVQDIRPGKEDTWYHGTGEIVGNSSRGGGAPFRGNGIYKSTDNGETWNPIPSTQDSSPNLFNSQFQYIWNIEINPENLTEDEVLVAAFGGILRSVDGGDSWEVGLGQQLFNIVDGTDLNESTASFYTSIERSENNVFYATLSTQTPVDTVVSPEAGFYYSLDGQEWVNITPLTEESRYRRVAISSSPSNPDITYFFIDSSPVFILSHSLAGINNPSRVNGFDPQPRTIPDFDEDLGILNTQGSYNMMVRVHPDDPNMVFVGGTNLFRSTDGFRTEENISWIGGYNPEGGSSIYPNHHPDQHDLLFLPSNPDRALSASDGGLILTEDITADSVKWQSRNSGFITSQFFTIAQSKTPNDPTVIGGMQDNGTDLSSGESTSWDGLLGGDGGYAATTKDNLLWFSSFQRGQTLRLTLNNNFDITSFGRVDPGGLVSKAGGVYLFINPFALDPINPNRMFCAGGNHLYYHPNVSQIPSGSQKPTNLGWMKVNIEPLDNDQVSAVEVAADGSKVYFGTSIGQLFRLDNADDQLMFDLVAIDSLSNGYVSSIAINPEDSDHIIVVFSSYNIPSIFESKDGGESFVDVSGNLEENPDGTGSGPSIRWAEIIPKNSGNLFLVGTSTGLYGTENLDGSSTIWVKESPDLIGSAIITMMDYRPSDGRLVIASHGNGVYAANISDFKQIEPIISSGEQFNVMATYPNPFQDATQIQYTIPEDGEVRIDILYPNGGLINTILWAPQIAGTNSVSWEGTTPSGTTLTNGIYFYRIQYAGQTKSGRLLLRR